MLDLKPIEELLAPDAAWLADKVQLDAIKALRDEVLLLRAQLAAYDEGTTSERVRARFFRILRETHPDHPFLKIEAAKGR